MTNPNDSSRFDGLHTAGEEGTQPMQSCVLPEDFGQRLERLKEASGLSWRGMAKALGVDPKQLLRWWVSPGVLMSQGARSASTCRCAKNLRVSEGELEWA